MQKKYRETLKIKGHIERSIVSFIFSCFCRSVDVIHVRIMYQLIIVLHVPVSVRWDNRTNHRCVCVCVCVRCSGGVYWRCYLGHVTARARGVVMLAASREIYGPPSPSVRWPVRLTVQRVRRTNWRRSARVVGQQMDNICATAGHSSSSSAKPQLGWLAALAAVWFGPAGSSWALTDRQTDRTRRL